MDRDRLIRDNELFSSHMKKMFGRIRRGRKCSKKLSIACDFDRNGGLSLEEWRKCLAGTFQKGTRISLVSRGKKQLNESSLSSYYNEGGSIIYSSNSRIFFTNV